MSPSISFLKSAVMAAMAVCLVTAAAYASDSNTNSPPAKKTLTGADLYAINCNRCHPDRFPVEWRSAQGKTVMTHMRVRANIPAEQARLILKYLQEESGK